MRKKKSPAEYCSSAKQYYEEEAERQRLLREATLAVLNNLGGAPPKAAPDHEHPEPAGSADPGRATGDQQTGQQANQDQTAPSPDTEAQTTHSKGAE